MLQKDTKPVWGPKTTQRKPKRSQEGEEIPVDNMSQQPLRNPCAENHHDWEMHALPGRAWVRSNEGTTKMIGQKQPRKLIPPPLNLRLWDTCGRAILPSSFTLLLSAWVPLFNNASFVLSVCLLWQFISKDSEAGPLQEPIVRPIERVPSSDRMTLAIYIYKNRGFQKSEVRWKPILFWTTF